MKGEINMKNIQNYAEKVKIAIEALTGMETKIVHKLNNNDEQRIGITISSPNSNISPVMYLAESDVDKPVNETAANIIRACQSQKPGFDFEVDQFTDFEQAKNRIIMRLINKEKSAKLLQDVPHIDVAEDLSIVFYYNVKNNKEQANIKILNKHLKSCWPEVTVEQLYEVAKINTPNFYPAEILDMGAYISEKTGCSVPETEFYIMTNRQNLFGATVGFYPRICDEFCSIHNCNKFIILPSSVHELLICPVDSEDNISEMVSDFTDIVKSVNASDVIGPNDFLSDNVYLYDMLTKEIKILHTEN